MPVTRNCVVTFKFFFLDPHISRLPASSTYLFRSLAIIISDLLFTFPNI